MRIGATSRTAQLALAHPEQPVLAQPGASDLIVKRPVRARCSMAALATTWFNPVALQISGRARAPASTAAKTALNGPGLVVGWL